MKKKRKRERPKPSDPIARVVQVISAAAALINIIKFIVEHWPINLFGEEPDGAAHRWLEARLNTPRHPRLPKRYKPRTKAYDWSSLKQLYQSCEHVLASMPGSTDTELADKVLAVIDGNFVAWFNGLDEETRSHLST
jgi:hypothetical protein